MKVRINGALVAKRREDRNISRAALARRVGVETTTLYRIETGRTGAPRLATVHALADALDVPLRELVEVDQVRAGVVA